MSTHRLFEVPLSKEDNLLKCFEEIHDFIYSKEGLSPQQTLEEFVKILFIKIYDESSSDKDFFNIRNLFNDTKKQYADVFESDDRIRLSDETLSFIVSKLHGTSLSDSAADVKGLAFQKFLSRHEKGDRGQFFTPQPVVDFCVEFINPKYGETILDPACGSGGFLISSLNHLQSTDLSAKHTITECLFGFEINKSIARIAKMKLLLEANTKTNIFCVNSLDKTENLFACLRDTEGVDIILTNPPFGAKISGDDALLPFELGRKWQKDNGTYYKSKKFHNAQTAELLFVEQCLNLLKYGGRMGIVLPNGNFDNSSFEYFRQYVKSRANVLAVVRLPQETFIPYGTGVKTSLLFLEKKGESSRSVSVFFSSIAKLGYQGNKNGTPLYQKDKYGAHQKDEKGNPILDEDFSTVLFDYQQLQQGVIPDSNTSFIIPQEELNSRFDYDYYSPDHKATLNVLHSNGSVRLADVCEILKEKSDKIRKNGEVLRYVELSDINTYSFEIINSTILPVHELPSRASYEIKSGDILTAISGNSVGTPKHAIAYVSDKYDGCICSNGFRVLRNFKIDPYFLLYYLSKELFLKQVFVLRTGAAIPCISDTDLSNIRIFLPTAEKIQAMGNSVKKAIQLRLEAEGLLSEIGDF